MRILDLSVSIVDGLPVDPSTQIAHIEYSDHQQGVQTIDEEVTTG